MGRNQHRAIVRGNHETRDALSSTERRTMYALKWPNPSPRADRLGRMVTESLPVPDVRLLFWGNTPSDARAAVCLFSTLCHCKLTARTAILCATCLAETEKMPSPRATTTNREAGQTATTHIRWSGRRIFPAASPPCANTSAFVERPWYGHLCALALACSERYRQRA